MKYILIYLLINITTINAIELTQNQINVINTISKKYNQYKSIKSRFIQLDENDNIQESGWFAIQRPGRARIESTSNNIRYIANSGTLLLLNLATDEKLMLPMNASVFSYLLQENKPLLSDDVLVLDYKDNKNTLLIKITDKNNQAIGNLTLNLDKSTGYLLGWIVEDALNQITKVKLQETTFSTKSIKPSSMFNVQRTRNITFDDIVLQ